MDAKDPARYGFDRGAAIVVTGGASGIGRAVVDVAVDNGLRIGLWDRDGGALSRTASELRERGAAVCPVEVDVTDPVGVRAAFERTVHELGRVRYLVNNAGPSSFEPTEFTAGLVAAAGSVAIVTSAWIELGSLPGDAVVSISSVAGAFVGMPGQGWYPASKAAIAGYTRHLAVQAMGAFRANAVAPGATRTPRLEDWLTGDGAQAMARNPLGRAGEPAEIAAVVCFLLSPAASYVNGVVIPVDGGSILVL